MKKYIPILSLLMVFSLALNAETKKKPAKAQPTLTISEKQCARLRKRQAKPHFKMTPLRSRIDATCKQMGK